MGAFTELFGFEGRLDRVGYLWRTLVVGLGIGTLAFVGRSLLELLVRPLGAADYQTGAHALAVGIVLLAIWASAAVTSRRLRDMGLEPVHILPVYIALWLAYMRLLQPLSQLRPEQDGLLLAGWGGLQALPPLFLLFWPGHSQRPPLPADFEPPQHTAYQNWREHV